MYIIIICVAIITIFFRSIGLFINLPDNKKVDKFFSAIPISILSTMIFPEVFRSIGNTKTDYLLVTTAIIIVILLTLKKKSLTFITFFILAFILCIKELIRYGNF